ncbi:hypothetical protein LTR15_006230 [Elasticomyces elasticus]|nr:hypothetical protein LTR15_006230 [Elasticomyces elasticus]
MAPVSKIPKLKKSKTNARTQVPFRLFALPPELWSHICRLAVPQGQIIEIEGSMSDCEALSKVQQPPITRTCETIREETIDVFYTNTFVFFDNDLECELFRWLDFITTNERMQKLLPKMVIRSWVNLRDSEIDSRFNKRCYHLPGPAYAFNLAVGLVNSYRFRKAMNPKTPRKMVDQKNAQGHYFYKAVPIDTTGSS